MTPAKILTFAIGPAGAAAISLITLPFVAWFFSPEDVGRLTMLQVVLGLAASFFSLGMNQAYVREYHEEADKPLLFKAAVLPGLALLALTIAGLSIQPAWISNALFGVDSSILSVGLFVSVVASFLIYFLGHVVRMQERGLAFSATQVVPKALLLVLIGAIFIFDFKAEFETLMLMSVLSTLGSAFVFAALTRDTWVPAVARPIRPVLLKQMLLFSLPLVLGGLAYWGLTTLDRFFLKRYAGFQELGIYAMSASLGGAVALLSTIFSNLWHPVVYKWVKEGVDVSKVQKVTEAILLLVSFIWSGFGCFSWVLLYFLPEEYRPVEYLIVAAVAGPLLYVLSETTVVGIGITRRSGFAMLASVSALLVSVVLNISFIPEHGAIAAALSSVAAFFVFFVVRTECSALLWQSLPRLKIYAIVLIYMSVVFYVVACKGQGKFSVALWLGAFVLSSILLSKRFKDIFLFLSPKK